MTQWVKVADLVGKLLIWSLKHDDWNHFSCSTILLLGSCAFEYIHLLWYWTEYFRTKSLHEAIVQKPTAYIQAAQPLQPSHSSFVRFEPLCTEDAVRGWSRRSARGSWTLGTSKETSYSSSPGRPWGLLWSGHFLMKWTGSLFDNPSGQPCCLEEGDNMDFVFIFLYFSCTGILKRLKWTSPTWIKIIPRAKVDHQKFVFPVCHAGSRENSSCPRTKVIKATRGHTGHCWPWKDMVRHNQQCDVTKWDSKGPKIMFFVSSC